VRCNAYNCIFVILYTGLTQPDEDDYGYVSQEASAFYNKLMEKYTSTPSEEPKFSKKSLLKCSAADLNNTKVYTIMVPTDAHKYVTISLDTQRTPTRFGQPCGHHQGYKIQRLDIL
jgi:hypothetical protein